MDDSILDRFHGAKKSLARELLFTIRPSVEEAHNVLSHLSQENDTGELRDRMNTRDKESGLPGHRQLSIDDAVHQ